MSYDVGERIREFRKQAGLNQDQLAELSSLNRVTVAKYESGKVEPGAKALSRIADALEVSVDILLGRSTDETIASPEQDDAWAIRERLRRGEVLALTREDIDLIAGLIHVNKSVRFSGNRPLIVRPKTAAGTRSVPILSILYPFLKNAPERAAATKTGEVMTDTAFRRAWDSYLLHLSRAAGHEISIRPHDLRHTYCARFLRDAGVDMKQAMIWMGHADEKMILRVYDHPGKSREQDAKNRLNERLSMQNGMQK